MTPQQALDLLDQVSSRLQADRQTHAACVQAVQTLTKFIEAQSNRENQKEEK